MRYGDTARPWPGIVKSFDGLAASNETFRQPAALARQIARSEFPAAGLHGLTSMGDTLIGPSAAVLDNPFLRIAYDFAEDHFVLTYEPGGERMATREPRWRRIVEPDEAWPAIERFLTRRARWYRVRAPGVFAATTR